MNDLQMPDSDRETRLRLLAIYAPLGVDSALDRAQAAYTWVEQGVIVGTDPAQPGADQTIVWPLPARRTKTDHVAAGGAPVLRPAEIPAALAACGLRQRAVLAILAAEDGWTVISPVGLAKCAGIPRQQVEQILARLRHRGLIDRQYVDGVRQVRVVPDVLQAMRAERPEPPTMPVAPIPAAPAPKPVAAAPPPPLAAPVPRQVVPRSPGRDAPAVDYLRSCGQRVLPSTNNRWLIGGDLDPVSRDELWRRARKLAAHRGDDLPRPTVEIPTGGAA